MANGFEKIKGAITMRKRILLVEDDEEIRSMIKDYLSGEFEVCFFSDGKTAMRKLANLDEYSLP